MRSVWNISGVKCFWLSQVKILNPGKTNCYIKFTNLQVTNLHDLWSTYFWKFLCLCSFLVRFCLLNDWYPLVCFICSFCNRNVFLKIIHNWNPEFPLCCKWKTLTNLYNLWSHLLLKIPMQLQFSAQIFSIKWLASLSMLYSQFSQQNSF